MDNTKIVSIIVADTHPIIRLGIRYLVKESFNCIIYEAVDGDQLFELATKHSPDIILMDINMPNTNPQTLIHNMLLVKADLGVLIFSASKEEIYGKFFLKFGARGYLQKSCPPEEIIKAIHTILDGNVYIRKEMQSIYIGGGAINKDAAAYTGLTKKEFETLHYLDKGEALTSIARIMNLSPSTIGTHKAKLFAKLQVTNMQELREFLLIHPLL